MNIYSSYAVNNTTDIVVSLGNYTPPTGSTVQQVADDPTNGYKLTTGQDNGLYLTILAPQADVVLPRMATFADVNNTYYSSVLQADWYGYAAEDKVKDHPIHGPHKAF